MFFPFIDILVPLEQSSNNESKSPIKVPLDVSPSIFSGVTPCV
jgi:hypothetical protein